MLVRVSFRVKAKRKQTKKKTFICIKGTPFLLGSPCLLCLFLFVYCVFSNYLLVFLCLFFVAKALSWPMLPLLHIVVMLLIIFFVACHHYCWSSSPYCSSLHYYSMLPLLLIITILLVVAVIAHSCLATKPNNSTTFTCHLVAYLSSPCYSSYFPPFLWYLCPRAPPSSMSKLLVVVALWSLQEQ